MKKSALEYSVINSKPAKVNENIAKNQFKLLYQERQFLLETLKDHWSPLPEIKIEEVKFENLYETEAPIKKYD